MPAKKQKQPNQTADDLTITVPSFSYSDSGSLFNGVLAQDIMGSVTIPAYTGGGSYDTLISSGSSYTVNASTSWSQDYSFNNVTSSNVHISGDGITMEPQADIKIGDRSLKEFMNSVEEQLAILRPAPELEAKWDQLKDLRQQYEAVKADILEKEKLMDILKKD
jgi:hypothetical protein